MHRSSKSEAVMVMGAATWGAVVEAITTVGAEVAIAVGGKLSTELISRPPQLAASTVPTSAELNK